MILSFIFFYYILSVDPVVTIISVHSGIFDMTNRHRLYTKTKKNITIIIKKYHNCYEIFNYDYLIIPALSPPEMKESRKLMKFVFDTRRSIAIYWNPYLSC